MKKTNSFIKIGLIYTISNVIIKGMAFLTTPIFTRIMSQAEYGSFSNISSWANIISIVATLSLYSSISRAKYDYGDKIDAYMSTITVIGSLFTLIIWALLETNIELWEHFFDMNKFHIRSIMLYALFMPAVQTLITKHRMYNEYKRVIVLTWVTLTVTTAASLVLTCVWPDKLTGRVFGTYAVVAIVDIIFWIYVIAHGKKVSLKMCKYACVLSLPLLVHELSGVLLNSSDRIIINQICGETDAALYSIAYTISLIITIVMSSVNQAWVPWFFDKLNEEKLSEIRKAVPAYTAFFTIGCIGLMLVGPELVLIFGGKAYMEAIYVIPPVCFAIELQFVYTLYVNIEFYLKKNHFISIATLLATAINIALNYLLIPKFGYIAAAYTTVIGYFCAMTFHYFVCSKTQYRDLFARKVLLINLAICLLAMFAVLVLYTFNIIRIIMIICIVVFGIILLAIKRKTIADLVKKLQN